MLDHLLLESSTEFPAFFTIFYTVILSFILSSIVAFTHYKTSRDIAAPIEFLQSLILVSVVSATVMQAIGDSLARGLGMLGALAIIRYRTTLKTPRNMVFTFAALAAGIACGVYAFVIALTGTIGFCVIAFVLKYSPLSKKNLLIGTLSFQQPLEDELQEVEKVLTQWCRNFRQIKLQIAKPKKQLVEALETRENDQLNYSYEISFKTIGNCKSLYHDLSQIESISQVKLNFENVAENV